MFELLRDNVHPAKYLHNVLKGLKSFELWTPANQDFCNLISKHSYTICCGFYRTSTECESDTRWRGFKLSIEEAFRIKSEAEGDDEIPIGYYMREWFAHPNKTTCIAICMEPESRDLYVISLSTNAAKGSITHSIGKIPYAYIQYLTNSEITEWLKESIMKVLDKIDYHYEADFYYDEHFFHSHGIDRYIKF